MFELDVIPINGFKCLDSRSAFHVFNCLPFLHKYVLRYCSKLSFPLFFWFWVLFNSEAMCNNFFNSEAMCNNLFYYFKILFHMIFSSCFGFGFSFNSEAMCNNLFYYLLGGEKEISMFFLTININQVIGSKLQIWLTPGNLYFTKSCLMA